MKKLSADNLLEICEWLSPSDIFSFQRTCRSNQVIANEALHQWTKRFLSGSTKLCFEGIRTTTYGDCSDTIATIHPYILDQLVDEAMRKMDPLSRINRDEARRLLVEKKTIADKDLDSRF